MFTTAQAAVELNISQRLVQRRMQRLGLDVKYVGPVALLTFAQVEKIRADVRKPGPKPKGKNGTK